MDQFTKFCQTAFSALVTIIALLLLLVVLDKFYFVDSQDKSEKTHQEYKLKEQVSDADKAQKIADDIWCENRSSKKSMDLVLSVIHTRAKEKTLDGLYKEAIKSKQFSCLNSEDIMANQVRNPKDMEMMQYAQYLVARFQAGRYKPIVKAKFYYAADKIAKPKYLENKQLVLAFEGHHFYN